MRKTTAADSFADFVRQRVGANWVIAKRTSRIVAKYGDDVVGLTPARYRKLQADYERETLCSPHGGPAQCLIDAAPDMVDVLRQLVEADNLTDLMAARAAGRAVLAKATGRARTTALAA